MVIGSGVELVHNHWLVFLVLTSCFRDVSCIQSVLSSFAKLSTRFKNVLGLLTKYHQIHKLSIF